MQDIYAIQSSVPNLRVPASLTVIGAGGTGYWFAFMAAMSGVKRLIVFEPSDIRATDVARFPVLPTSVGRKTIDELHDLVKRFRPEIDFASHPYHFKLEEHADLIEGKLVISLDDLRLKRRIADFATAKSIEYVVAPYFEDASAVFHNHVPQSLLMDGRTVPNWAGRCTLSASLGITSLFSKPFSAIVSAEDCCEASSSAKVQSILGGKIGSE